MTAIADSKHRVTIREARPGDRFDVRIEGPGKYVLTKLEPIQSGPSKVRLVKRQGYTVGVLDHPIDPEALKQALADFP
jgi:phage FluMu protein gp41